MADNPFHYTPVNINWNLSKIKLGTVIASMGSCFADELVATLLDSGFSGAHNPNGILYNPLSIRNAFSRIVKDEPYTENDFFEFNKKWHSWNHHGDFSDENPDTAIMRAENARQEFRKTLASAETVVITESSAVVYDFNETGKTVANCHKIPGRLFTKRLLSTAEILENIVQTIHLVREINNQCNIIFTLSPVRHYPGDLVLNARSKAMLLSAIHEAVETNTNCGYFPAFEIVMDELRDYRFFADDMLHPSAAAREFVLKRFLKTCFTPECMNTFEEAELRRRRACHIEKQKR